MKKRVVFGAAALLAGLGLARAYFVHSQKGAAHQTDSPKPAAPAAGAVAAPGRVEPVSEEVAVGISVSGKIEKVLVEEGDRVRKGQVLATLDNADARARVAVAAAQLQQAEAKLRRVVNGAREQERREAAALAREAEAVLENARRERERRQRLFGDGDIARSELDRAEREYRVAASRVDAARERQRLVEDDAREEDRAQAEADVAYAQARLEEARALLGKTVIVAPIAGTVLRKHFRSGESISDRADTPVVTLGDSSVLRVRAEVDEADVARVKAGQKAYVKAAAYGERRFTGRVVRVGKLLGRKSVRTERPSERVDTKILETLIELDPGQELPAGLRVDVFIG